jgi:hypothetical protein
MNGYLLIFLIIPLYIYQTLGDHGKNVMLAGIGSLLLLGLIAYIGRYIGRMVVKAASFTRHPTYILTHWERGVTALDFQSGFANHIKSLGCQVLWSRILDTTKVAFLVEKQRHKVFLLCLGEIDRVRDTDLMSFDRWQMEHQADVAILVVPALSLSPGNTRISKAITVLTYEGLIPRLTGRDL